MIEKKGYAKGIATISLLLVVATVLGVFVFNYAVPVFANSHVSTAELYPEWSPANAHVDFTVQFCKVSGQSINEVRIYRNNLYSNFQCDDKPGWEKLYISTYPACFYVATDSSYYLDIDGECENFTFSADSPGPQYCNLQWQFETRDTQDHWTYLYDTTSVDDKAPVIIKTLGEPKIENGETWITQDTEIEIEVWDEGECGISGLDYCEYRYDVDGVEVLPWTTIVWGSTDEISGVMHYYYTFTYDEDSLHHLEIKCYDIAENMAYHEQWERVDTEEPVTTKVVSEPKKIENGVEWIDTATTITFNAVDPDPTQQSCNIGVYETYWRNTIVDDDLCWNNKPCEPLNDWFFLEETPNGFGNYVDGPDTPPLGDGSANLVVDATGGMALMKGGYNGLLLSTISTLSYSTYQNLLSPGLDIWAVSLQFNIDYDCNDADQSWQGRIVFEPVYSPSQGAPMKGVWQSWNARTGKWWASKPGVGFSGYKTIDEILATFPNACVHEVYGAVILKIGSGISPGFDGNVDNLVINGDTYDFELEGVNWNTYTGAIQKGEESCHLIEYFSVDKLGNTEDIQVNCFFVDTTPPEGVKTIGEPQYGSCPVDDWLQECEGWDCLKTEGKWDQKDFFTTGREDPTNWEMAIWNGNPEQVEESDEYSWGNGGDPVPFTVSYDADTGLVTYTIGQTTLTWTYDTDKAFEYLVLMAKGKHVCESVCDECDTSLTDVEVNGKEVGDVVSSGNYEGRKVYLADGEQSGGFTVTGYVSLNWDAGCKQQEIPAFHVFAMNTHDPEECWVRDDTYMDGTPITLTCTDPEPHPSGDEEVCFRISYDIEPWLTDDYCTDVGGTMQGGADDDWCCVDNTAQIVFHEDSLHDLEWFCRDAVDKKSPIDLEYFRVDSLPPIIEKDMFGSYLGDCPSGTDIDHGNCYVADDGTSGVEITVYDDDTYPECSVDDVTCEYELWWVEQNIDRGIFQDYKKITFTEDSIHTLKIWCWDALGNEVYDEEIFLVDSTPPETTKTYIGPYHEVDGLKWIDGVTLINLTATDEKVGVDEIRYRVSGALADKFCESCGTWMETLRPDMGPWQTYSDPFGILEESCHVIEYSSIDRLGNEEEIKWQCIFVDKTAPIIEKEYEQGDPYYTDGTSEWINKDTTITITVTDPDPHPSGVAETEYRYKVVDDNYCLGILDCQQASAESAGWSTLNDPTYGEFNIIDDSCHVIEIRSKDNVDKSSTHKQCVFVDNQAPEITKELVGPYYPDDSEVCPPNDEFDECYIDGVTNITVDAYDPDPHPVNAVKCAWEYEVIDNDDSGEGQDVILPFNITFPEESTHILTITCWDALGNEVTDVEKFIVDKTPPETTKTYDGPQWPRDCNPYCDGPKWITNETEVWLSAHDENGPHISGVNKTYYRDVYLESEDDWHYCYNNCTNWEYDERATVWGLPTAPEPYNPTSHGFVEWTGQPFYKIEESCHIIEYYSYDNVGKVEDVKHQCVFVDNTAPEPNKTVGEPKAEWDGQDANFYDIADKCWSEDPEEMIECWKITLLTPIKLDCVDPEPHPVDDEGICFKVDWDGEDQTEEYCDGWEGDMEDEFCCVNDEIEFMFDKISEHELEYYCVDALGNSNKENLDIEKFKVEETKFEIQINKKWNLISTPVVLLDDSMKEIFGEESETIEAVWTYDGETGQWHIYTPDGVENDDLGTMIPGWGYWVKALEDDTLVIGGSLMSPGKTPPSKSVVAGWNLIGYYGADGETEYDGPWGNGGDAYCELYSLGEDMWDKPFTSLWTYWEPDNPYQWIPLDEWNSMDPGAGYWLAIPQDGLYIPSTTCGPWW